MSFLKRSLAFAAFSFVTLTSVSAANDVLSELEPFVNEVMNISHTPGVAIAIVKEGDVVLTRGFGVREAGTKKLVDEDTVFAIGSMSKNFTAIALGLLVEEGRLSWNAPLTQYVPGLRFSDPYLFSMLSLNDALSHRTGLERADVAWFSKSGASRDEMLAVIERIQSEVPFRAGYLYNNFMYLAAGQAIPAVTDKSWDDFLEERLFASLKMRRTNTSAAVLTSMRNVATPHYLTDNEAIPTTYYNLDHMAPAGSINSTAQDMARWCQMQLANGEFRGEQIVPEKVIDAVRERKTFLPLKKTGHAGTHHNAYALGLERKNYGDAHIAYEHGGAIQGMASTIVFIPEEKVCVAVLTNGESYADVRTHVAYWILDRLLGLDAGDYIGNFVEALEKRRKQRNGLRVLHNRSHDPAAMVAFDHTEMVGRFRSPLYGEIIINEVDGRLTSQFGTGNPSDLKPHRGLSFDLHTNDTARESAALAPVIITAVLNSRANVSAIELEFPGPQTDAIRFTRVD
ncbi:serine hydrolase domain-containing protein [Hyphococcus sp. DH-69]|uniref:serine hydrolase domain-containing protein n=1 Tax=Hyphococcus formosus TaxID=3143534 RepID=UPI00398BBC47